MTGQRDTANAKPRNVALLVVPTEGGIVRGFTDPAAADAHARTTGGFVTRTPVVADHREKAS